MKRYAVIGSPIAHSLSPWIHKEFAKQFTLPLEYERFEVSAGQCHAWVREFFSTHGDGLNVTLPLKEKVLSLATHIHPRAQLAQAANTLWYKKDAVHADNTDGIGFLRDIERFIKLSHKKILILGAGGAAKGIIGQILQAGVDSLYVANRSDDKAQRLLQAFSELRLLSWHAIKEDFDIIINATSIGLPSSAFALEGIPLHCQPFVYDLNYQIQGLTPFLHYCKQWGWAGKDGIGMLVEQAAESFYLWHGLRPNTQIILQNIKTDTQ